MSPRVTHIARLALGAALAAGLTGPLAGCRGDRSDNPPRQFLPDMDDQPKWKPQSESAFFADGRTMRKPVEGTVPFGVMSVLSDAPWAAPANARREAFLAAESEIYEGVDEMGDFVEEIPVPISADLLRQGREKFNIYCAVCHGYNGEGSNPGADPTQGSMVGRRWSIPVASFHDERFVPGGEFGQAGYLFQIARHGKGVFPAQSMPGYRHALDAEETWAVIAYIRALQRANAGDLSDVPESERETLGSPPEPPQPAEPDSNPGGEDAATEGAS
jgi:mono/diheme cytochrome c family protein